MREFIRECLPPGEWKKNVPWEEVEELRLRSGRPVEAVCFDRVMQDPISKVFPEAFLP